MANNSPAVRPTLADVPPTDVSALAATVTKSIADAIASTFAGAITDAVVSAVAESTRARRAAVDRAIAAERSLQGGGG